MICRVRAVRREPTSPRSLEKAGVKINWFRGSSPPNPHGRWQLSTSLVKIRGCRIPGMRLWHAVARPVGVPWGAVGQLLSSLGWNHQDQVQFDGGPLCHEGILWGTIQVE
ncbi:hypothetical protein BDW74DRAFT_48352 [Aspergillus multicolor]|uniref:uncharacterized protein n=1 Tax=Aspergillus multicolor TaxID=41759 RepID=UPI003CCD90A6